MIAFDGVWHPHYISLLSLSFTAGRKGRPRRSGESHHHQLLFYIAQMSQGAHNHNDSRLLSLFADRDLQESVVELL